MGLHNHLVTNSPFLCHHITLFFFSLFSSRLNPFGLTIALDAAGSASGELFWDDGEMEHLMSETYSATITFASVCSPVLCCRLWWPFCMYYSNDILSKKKKKTEK